MINYLVSLVGKFKKTSFLMKSIIFSLGMFYIFIIVICTVRVNYEVTSPGGLNEAVSFITMENANFKGEINTVSVTVEQTNVTILRKWLSLLDKRVDISEYNPTVDLIGENYYLRNKVYKDIAVRDAIINAYQEAMLVDQTISIDSEYAGIIVISRTQKASSNIKFGDVITEIFINNTWHNIKDGAESRAISYITYFRELVSTIEGTQDFKLKIRRGDAELVKNRKEDEIDCNKYLSSTGDKYEMGVTISEYYDIIDTNPKISIDLTKKYTTTGPSGGMMMALSIYNMLIEEDITNSLKIAGTGEINFDGTIGAIGGVPQKIHTANMYGVDIFFIPIGTDGTNEKQNYEDALATYNSIINPGFELVPITSFTDVLNYLRGRRGL